HDVVGRGGAGAVLPGLVVSAVIAGAVGVDRAVEIHTDLGGARHGEGGNAAGHGAVGAELSVAEETAVGDVVGAGVEIDAGGGLHVFAGAKEDVGVFGSAEVGGDGVIPINAAAGVIDVGEVAGFVLRVEGGGDAELTKVGQAAGRA